MRITLGILAIAAVLIASSEASNAASLARPAGVLAREVGTGLAADSTAAAEAAKGVPADERKRLEATLPANGFFGAAKMEGTAKLYDAAHLYEYIDGQAEGYIDYRFQALASATYKDGDNSIVVDVYDMEKPVQAFGLYSTFRAPTNDFVDIGGQAFKSTEGYMFYKARFVVKVSADYADETEMMKAAEAGAKAAAAKIADDRSGLEILKILPEANKVPNSEKYYLQAVLGQSFLDNGVVAEYKIPGSPTRLFACVMNDSQAAAKAYGEYLTFATAHGKPVEDPSHAQFAGEVKYFAQTVVFTDGRVIAGGVGLPASWQPIIDDLKKSVTQYSAK
jgi:hypothetical protein